MSSRTESQFTHAGLDCAVVWHDMGGPSSYSPDGGHRCGYVRIPKGHPWHGKDYNAIVTGTPLADDEDGFDRYEDRMCAQVRVHGGLTYSGSGHASLPDGWWVGFDCAHYLDTAARWTTDAVAGEVKSLADQLAARASEVSS